MGLFVRDRARYNTVHTSQIVAADHRFFFFDTPGRSQVRRVTREAIEFREQRTWRGE
jgi:hypothetical protein